MKKRHYFTPEELHNPQPDLSSDAIAYGRLSTAKQWVDSPQSARAQTILLLLYTKRELGFKDDGSTGMVTLCVENQMAEDGTIKNASGTWPIDRRTGMRAILDLVEEGRKVVEAGKVKIRMVKTIIAEDVARLFRDEDNIDSNIFIKVCRENACFVHITSKRMTYNFENRTHRDLFRLEVQMAASYIDNHVRGVMLRRRYQMRELGLWIGTGCIPVNFTVDNREGSPTFDKYIPYWPHANKSVEYYDRLIELGFNIDLLCRELAQQPYVYPGFEDWVYKDYRVYTKLKPAPGGYGYTISRECLKKMFCNMANIGALKVSHEGREKILWNNHPSIFGEDDDETRFWMVYDHFKDTRPDGSPTGRKKLVRYMQKETQKKYPDGRYPLLEPVTSLEGGSVHFNRNSSQICYRLGIRRGLIPCYLLCVPADELEDTVVARLFERIRGANLAELKNRHVQRRQQYEKRLRGITRDLAEIENQLAVLAANLAKMTAPAVVEELGKSMERILERKQELLKEEESIQTMLADIGEETIEEELEHLEEVWERKSFEFKKGMLDLLLNKVIIDQVAPTFYRLTLEWAFGEWGEEETYMLHAEGGRKQWTEEEEEILRSVYLRTNSRETIMQALPTRSWRSIQHRIYLLGLREGKRKAWDEPLPAQMLSWNDREWLEGKGWSVEIFLNGNEVGWSAHGTLR